jgi:hypothetical protein
MSSYQSSNAYLIDSIQVWWRICTLYGSVNACMLIAWMYVLGLACGRIDSSSLLAPVMFMFTLSTGVLGFLSIVPTGGHFSNTTRSGMSAISYTAACISIPVLDTYGICKRYMHGETDLILALTAHMGNLIMLLSAGISQLLGVPFWLMARLLSAGIGFWVAGVCSIVLITGGSKYPSPGGTITRLDVPLSCAAFAMLSSMLMRPSARQAILDVWISVPLSISALNALSGSPTKGSHSGSAGMSARSDITPTGQVRLIQGCISVPSATSIAASSENEWPSRGAVQYRDGRSFLPHS